MFASSLDHMSGGDAWLQFYWLCEVPEACFRICNLRYSEYIKQDYQRIFQCVLQLTLKHLDTAPKKWKWLLIWPVSGFVVVYSRQISRSKIVKNFLKFALSREQRRQTLLMVFHSILFYAEVELSMLWMCMSRGSQGEADCHVLRHMTCFRKENSRNSRKLPDFKCFYCMQVRRGPCGDIRAWRQPIRSRI